MIQLEDWTTPEHVNGIFIGHGDLFLSSGKSATPQHRRIPHASSRTRTHPNRRQARDRPLRMARSRPATAGAELSGHGAADGGREHLVKLASDFRRPDRDLPAEYTQDLLARFGAEKLLWGSDSPFVGHEHAASYRGVVELGDSAYRFYFS